MFISPAYAQAFGGGGTDTLMQFAPLVLIFVVFYFFMIRPQQQKAKEHKAQLASLRRGDRVVTGGGILGTIVKVGNDDEILVEIAENTRVRVLRSSISTVLAKTEPVSAKGDDEKAEAESEESGDKRKGSGRRAVGGK